MIDGNTVAEMIRAEKPENFLCELNHLVEEVVRPSAKNCGNGDRPFARMLQDICAAHAKAAVDFLNADAWENAFSELVEEAAAGAVPGIDLAAAERALAHRLECVREVLAKQAREAAVEALDA